MGDSPDPPPPPPEYTKEKAAFSASELAKRQQQATDYNALVDQWNTKVSGYGTGLSDYQTKIGGLKLTDDEMFDSYLSGINSNLNNLYGTTFSASKPYWESTVMSPYGAVSVGMPTLNNADTQLKDSFITGYGSLRDQLNQLKQQRSSEEQKVNSFAQQLYGNLGNLNSRASLATIANPDMLNQLRTDYDTYKSMLDSFQSPILGDYNNPIIGSINSMFGGVDSRLKSLNDQRAAEIGRIKQYEQGILDRTAGFSNALGNLTIADGAGIDGLRRQLEDYNREVGRFSTAILPGQDYDFSQELGELGSVRDRLGTLQSERETELAKVKAFEDQINNAALGLASNARTANIYNLGTINDLAANIELAKQKMQGFSSALPANFTTANSQLSAAEQIIAQLTQQRNNALGQIRSRFENATGQFGNIQGYDETSLNNALNTIYGFQNNLTPFMGNDADLLRQDVQTQLTGIQDRMNSLASQRSDLERQAQALLTKVNAASFTDANGVQQSMTEAEALKTQVDLYKALQAMDEISSVMSRLDSEKKRIESDAANVTARTALEANNPLGGTTDITEMMNRITPEQYAELMALSRKVQTGEATVDQYNAFLRNLGMGV